jgi:2-succinyl-6-hydroxy-2,4-cyclohexadiene-1-carboxylate synthase
MMKIETQSIIWNAELGGSSSLPPLVLLHGFAQSLHSFDELSGLLSDKFRVLRVDLPGHGGTICQPDSLKWRALTSELRLAAYQMDSRPAHWFGYSQGGRVALMTALDDGASIKSLMLLGASPGIADAQARQTRRDSDALLAQNIRNRGIDWFASYWEALPIFSSQWALPEEKREKIRRERLKCDPRGLAFALENFGTGTQPDCLARLREWNKPLMLLAGEHDVRFAASNRAISEKSQAIPFAHHVISGAGHAAHIERPATVAQQIQEFCNSIKG